VGDVLERSPDRAVAVRVTICDVGPRDGLQNEPGTLPPATRAELVNRLAAAGLPRIEAASFVRPDAVPQMAGARRWWPGSSAGPAPSTPGSR
jgi:isopropylmalate/homocitrate/citramalate synthase